MYLAPFFEKQYLLAVDLKSVELPSQEGTVRSHANGAVVRKQEY
jgi:hypothetical protein